VPGRCGAGGRGRTVSAATLAERLGPVQDTLTELEREARAAAVAGSLPDAWANWADLQAALMAVRAVQGRDARSRRYAPPALPAASPSARSGAWLTTVEYAAQSGLTPEAVRYRCARGTLRTAPGHKARHRWRIARDAAPAIRSGTDRGGTP